MPWSCWPSDVMIRVPKLLRVGSLTACSEAGLIFHRNPELKTYGANAQRFLMRKSDPLCVEGWRSPVDFGWSVMRGPFAIPEAVKTKSEVPQWVGMPRSIHPLNMVIFLARVMEKSTADNAPSRARRNRMVQPVPGASNASR